LVEDIVKLGTKKEHADTEEVGRS